MNRRIEAPALFEIQQIVSPDGEWFRNIDLEFRDYQDAVQKLLQINGLFTGQMDSLEDQIRKWSQYCPNTAYINLGESLPTIEIRSEQNKIFPIDQSIGARWIGMLHEKSISTPFGKTTNALYIPHHLALIKNRILRGEKVTLVPNIENFQ